MVAAMRPSACQRRTVRRATRNMAATSAAVSRAWVAGKGGAVPREESGRCVMFGIRIAGERE